MSTALNFIQIITGFSNILGFLLGVVFGLFSLVLWLGRFILCIYLIVRSYQGEDPRIPVGAGVVENLV